MSEPIFSDGELNFLASCPDVLRALADYHFCQETMADAVGLKECANYSRDKAEQYQLWAAEADGRILTE